MLPCRRFADVLAGACARLGADVDRYSFIEVGLHHKLLAGLPAHSLALRPAHSRRHLYVTCYTEGFSHFVTSMTAPVASGWSVRRVGLSPTGKRRLLTAHANSGRSLTVRKKMGAVRGPCRSGCGTITNKCSTRDLGGPFRRAQAGFTDLWVCMGKPSADRNGLCGGLSDDPERPAAMLGVSMSSPAGFASVLTLALLDLCGPVWFERN